MYLKSVIKYTLYESKKSLFIFYCVIIAVMLGFFSIAAGVEKGTVNFSANETIGMTFIFIASLVSFKESFRMLIQNGVSRKTTFMGQVIWILCMSGIMSFVDRILGLFCALGNLINSRFIAGGGLLENLYPSRYVYDPGNILTHLAGIAFSICLYIAFAALGYFIVLLYYRMSTPLKVAVSISVPCFLFIGLPIIDNLTNGKISYFFDRVGQLIFGVNGSNGPISAMLFSLVCAALLCGLGWLLIRKAPIKN